MEPIDIKIKKELYPITDFGYTVRCVQGKRASEEVYKNRATGVSALYILSEEGKKPFCIVDDRGAAENALYHLATTEAEKKLKELRPPRIIDETQ